MAAKAMAHGFDAESNEYVDMIHAGIIDPTKVERVALQNAASIASLLLTTEALITDIAEKTAAMPPMPHGGGDFSGRLLKKAHMLRWRPRQQAQRTESTPRLLPSGAASHLDLFEQPAGFSSSINF